eukprot:CAMPEP_0195595630 /NCGR_PEP_ID=MMETSP0815-20121206/2039_1 /TAXON_ID=97485 /ORGANISM="Prymnesium parvum, Strain Texoma1" /LENGTH=73 /DNA_ID=CAMNT_0040734887 /DNA_START=1329 /DNA_END=1550 /DNA_ORIENTATION=+
MGLSKCRHHMTQPITHVAILSILKAGRAWLLLVPKFSAGLSHPGLVMLHVVNFHVEGAKNATGMPRGATDVWG